MANTIKRNTKQMTIRTKTDGVPPKNTTIEISKNEFGDWVGGGFLWLVAHLRNSDFVEILEQRE